MTLCMAAMCSAGDNRGRLLVISLDTRAEKDWAGGNVATKIGWAASPGWPALFAGEISKAEDFLATARTMLNPAEFTSRNIFDKLNEVSSAHKEKLVRRLVQRRLGISFERFLEAGEKELTSEIRSRLLYDITNVDFGCSVIILGYVKQEPSIFLVDNEGEVQYCQNFGTIGTGSVIADATLYQREQNLISTTVERTLYNMYEAATLARIAPGVGETKYFAVCRPTTTRSEGISIELVSTSYIKHLAGLFKKYGPKPIGKAPAFPPDVWARFIPTESEFTDKPVESPLQNPQPKKGKKTSKRKKP